MSEPEALGGKPKSSNPTRRTFIKANLAAGVTGLPLFAPSSAWSQGKKTIRYWTWLDPKDTNGRSRAQEAALDGFRKKNPNIDLVVEVVDWRNIPQQLLLAVGAGKGPDVVRLFNPTLPQLVAAKALRPLNQFIDAWSKDQKADIIPPFAETTWDGNIMATFIENRAFVLYYRDDLAKQSGRKPPATWGEVRQLARAVRTDQRMGIAFPMNRKFGAIVAGFHMPALMWSFGGELVDASGKGTFNSPAGVKLFQYMADMAKERLMAPEVIGWDNDQATQGIMTGTLAMMYEGTNRLGHMRTAMKQPSDLQVISLPTETGAPNPSPVAGWTLGMSRDAKDPEAAWQLIDAITSTESQVINAKVGGEMPTRRSAMKDPWFAGPEGSEMRGWLQHASAHPRVNHAGKLVNINQLGDIITSAAQEIVLGQKPIQPTLDQAVARWNTVAR